MESRRSYAGLEMMDYDSSNSSGAEQIFRINYFLTFFIQGVRKVTQLFNCSIRDEKINRSYSAIHHLKEQKRRFLKLQCMFKKIPTTT